jgi:hypothetical protein
VRQQRQTFLFLLPGNGPVFPPIMNRARAPVGWRRRRQAQLLLQLGTRASKPSCGLQADIHNRRGCLVDDHVGVIYNVSLGSENVVHEIEHEQNATCSSSIILPRRTISLLGNRILGPKIPERSGQRAQVEEVSQVPVPID